MKTLYLSRISWLVLMVALASALVACQLMEEILPTPLPAAREQPVATVAPVDESPRLGNSMEVPPTWTPTTDEASTSETPISSSEITPESAGEASYVVQPGDTLAEIAQQFNVTIEDLALANAIDDLDHIEAGQVLVIPGF